MQNFIVNITFYAGSEEPEDTDRGLYVLHIESQRSVNVSEAEELLTVLSDRANIALDPYMDQDGKTETVGFTYEEGLNLGTLVKGINILGKPEGITLEGATGFTGVIRGAFELQQWQ